MVTDVFESISILGVIETLVFNLPAAFRHKVKGLTASLRFREVGQPIRFDDRSIRLVLQITDYPDGFPAKCHPWVEVVGIPDFNAIPTVPKFTIRRFGGKAFAGRLG